MFWFVRQDLFTDHGVIDVVGHTPVTGDLLWTQGVRFEAPVPKQTLRLDAASGTRFPDFFDTTIPLMSPRLVEALRGAGIDNFDAYPMLLERNDTGEATDGYLAVNLIGCVDAVDAARSPHRTRFGKPHFTGSIALDPAKTEGLEAFRLKHGPDFMVVSERVARLLVEGEFFALLVQPTSEFAGD